MQEIECFLLETFNAFDGDGSAQMGFPEYKEAWKFLNRPGDEAEVKKVSILSGTFSFKALL